MSRTHHARRGRIYDGNHGSPFHRYHGGSSGKAWREKYMLGGPDKVREAERVAFAPDDAWPVHPMFLDGMLVTRSRPAEPDDYDAYFYYPDADAWDSDSWDSDAHYYDGGYYQDLWDDYQHDDEPALDDARWVVAWVDGAVNEPPEYYSMDDIDPAFFLENDLDPPWDDHEPVINDIEAAAIREDERRRRGIRRKKTFARRAA